MAITLQDSFTDADGTLLSAHDPDVGDAGSWTFMDFGTGGGDSPDADLIIDSGVLSAQPDGSLRTYRNDTDPGADEYDVECDFTFDTSSGLRFLWVDVRMTPTGTADGDVDRYMVFGNNDGSQQWVLYKIVSGSLTELDSQGGSLVGNTFAMLVEVRDGSITVFANEVQILSTSDTDITQRGRVGLGIRHANVSEQVIDNLSVDSIMAGTPQVTATIPLTIDIAAATAAQHEATASIPLDLDVAATAATDHRATATLPLELDLAVAATAGHAVTAAIPLTIDLAAVGQAEPIVTPPQRVSRILPDVRTSQILPDNRTSVIRADNRVSVMT